MAEKNTRFPSEKGCFLDGGILQRGLVAFRIGRISFKQPAQNPLFLQGKFYKLASSFSSLLGR